MSTTNSASPHREFAVIVPGEVLRTPRGLDLPHSKMFNTFEDARAYAREVGVGEIIEVERLPRRGHHYKVVGHLAVPSIQEPTP